VEDCLKISWQDIMGKPFQYGGRGPNSYDCYGLIIELNNRLNRFMPPDFISTSDVDIICKQIDCATSIQFNKLLKPIPFCLVTFFIKPRITSHIGMVLPNLYQFIHITENTSVSIDRLDSHEWSRRITGYWEHVTWV